jgi:hypothetical protein
MNCREALEIAAHVLRFDHSTDPEVVKARKVLDEILEQCGCEHFDSSVEDGRLTTLMDVVIYG